VRCYFDHAASSPAVQACLDAYAWYDAQPWAGANPNSLHSSGRKAFEALESARARLARHIGARRPSELVFTGGGTEANNLAVFGAAHAIRVKSNGSRNRVLVFSMEHDSVLDPALALARDGRFSVEKIPATPQGTVDLQALDERLGPDVALVSVMAANNEVGTLQPLEALVGACHNAGALVHTDAVQAFGHVPFNVSAIGVDYASFAAHKIGGPVGCGMLYVKSRSPLEPQSIGGGQESGFRSGTQNVRDINAFAATAQDACDNLDARTTAVHGLANLLVDLVSTGSNPVALPTVEGPREGRFLPGVVHFTVPGHQSEGLVLGLDKRGFETSGGSACSSSSLEPSHVLTAMGIPRDRAFCALRVSFDHRTTADQCRALADALKDVCSTSGRNR